MDPGVCDLEVACFKANFTWINDIGSKDLSNRPIYAVLNTHNLHVDMILQLKYMMYADDTQLCILCVKGTALLP